MRDSYNRIIDYMRVSITDRCNLRCKYCMPEGIELVPMKKILTCEEILAICRAGADAGISKLKVTGGEPLVRRGAVSLIREMKKIPGIEQVTLTTNGVLLGQYLGELAETGINGINISLDTLDRAKYQEITGSDLLGTVLESIDRSIDSGIRTKVNVVLQKGVNEEEWQELARLAQNKPLDVRFIELMPIGFGRLETGISGEVLLAKMQETWPGLVPDGTDHGNGPAVYYGVPGWQGSIGFINAIHGRFCGSCNRLRLTSMGKLKPCLCYGDTVDLMPILRDEKFAGEENALMNALSEAIERAVRVKPMQHCFEISEGITEKARMAEIGG